MIRLLPANPHLKQLRNQARDILKAHKKGDASCCLILRNLHHFRDAANQEILSRETRLTQVQFALALEYGFRNWTELTHVVKARRTESSSSLIDSKSLAATLDRVGEALFYGRPITTQDRIAVAECIAARQGQAGAYAGMFAPVGNELEKGMRVFTGERISSSASARHILGEEACRVLHLLGVDLITVTTALAKASEGVVEKLDDLWGPLEHSDRPWRQPGLFCCGTCSVALWRHLAARGDPYARKKLAVAIAALRQKRAGDGTWTGFPFHYTLLMLLETDLPSVRAEMIYAAGACEAYLGKRTSKNNVYSQRRRRIVAQVLAKCQGGGRDDV